MLICVFAGRACRFVGFVTRRLKYKYSPKAGAYVAYKTEQNRSHRIGTVSGKEHCERDSLNRHCEIQTLALGSAMFIQQNVVLKTCPSNW